MPVLSDTVIAQRRAEAQLLGKVTREQKRRATIRRVRRLYPPPTALTAERIARVVAVFHPRDTPWGDTPTTQWQNLLALAADAQAHIKPRTRRRT